MKLLIFFLVFSAQVCSYFKDPLVCIGTVAMEQIVSRFAVTSFFLSFAIFWRRRLSLPQERVAQRCERWKLFNSLNLNLSSVILMLLLCYILLSPPDEQWHRAYRRREALDIVQKISEVNCVRISPISQAAVTTSAQVNQTSIHKIAHTMRSIVRWKKSWLRLNGHKKNPSLSPKWVYVKWKLFDANEKKVKKFPNFFNQKKPSSSHRETFSIVKITLISTAREKFYLF